jgi:hypothetical protein
MLRLPGGQRRAVRCPECACVLDTPAPREAATVRRPLPGWAVPALLAGVALVPLGIPVVARGSIIDWTLAGGLAALGVVLACWPWGSPVVRGCLTLTAAVAGYALALTVLRQEDPGQESIPPGITHAPRPASPGGPEGLEGWVAPNTKELRQTRLIGALLDVAFAPAHKAALVAREDGTLDHYSYPDFKTLKGHYKLEQPAYRIAVDAARGRLLAAVAPPADPKRPESLLVNAYGDRPQGSGDLHVYDISALLAGKPTGKTLPRIAVLPLAANVSHLLFAAPHDCFYYLAHGRGGTAVGRVAGAEPVAIRGVDLPGATALCLSPDGSTLYGGGGLAGRRAWTPTRSSRWPRPIWT